MRNLSAIYTCLFIFLATQAFGQKSVRFKPHLKPEHVYNEDSEKKLDLILEYKGSQEFLDKLKESKVQNPQATHTYQKITTRTVTGKLAERKFPLNVEFVKTIDSTKREKSGIPDGTKVYGWAYEGEGPVFEEVTSPGMTEEMRKGMLKGVQSLFSQMEFPDRQLSIGDTFSKQVPFNFPGEYGVRMTVISTYKLLSIENNHAKLGITMSYVFKNEDSRFRIKGTGSGEGYVVYDIKEEYTSETNILSSIQMTTHAKDFDIDMSMKNTILDTITFGSK